MRDDRPVSTRVLIFTASIGAGHDLPAEVLATSLRERGATAEVVDGLQVGGPVARAVVGGASSLEHLPGNLAFEAGYVLGTRLAPMRRAGSRVIEQIMGRRFERFLADHPADVIVSTYPLTTELLGRMRKAGTLATPVVSAITDLAALHYWAHPGVDLHLITHPESAAEVREIAARRRRSRPSTASPTCASPSRPSAARRAPSSSCPPAARSSSSRAAAGASATSRARSRRRCTTPRTRSSCSPATTRRRAIG